MLSAACIVMGLGYCSHLSLVFVFSFMLFIVSGNPVRNDTTGMPYETDPNWKGESGIPTPTQTGIPKMVGLLQICEQKKHSFLLIFTNGSNLALEASGSSKKKNESKPVIVQLRCHHGKGSQTGILEPGCEIVIAFCGIDQPAISSWSQMTCPSENPRSHKSSNKSFQNVTVGCNVTKEECGRRLGTCHTRQSKVNRLYQVQPFIRRGLCVRIPKRMEKRAKCCNEIEVLCIIPTSHANETCRLKSIQRDVEPQLDYDRARDVEDYINQSIIGLVACVVLIIGVFLTVMTYNLWSSRKRYQDSLKSQNVKKA